MKRREEKHPREEYSVERQKISSRSCRVKGTYYGLRVINAKDALNSGTIFVILSGHVLPESQYLKVVREEDMLG